MDSADILDLFIPIGHVTLRRMFGGHGIYADGRIFALHVDGAIMLKADEINRPEFEAAGSQPFTYAKRDGIVAVMSYWALPAACFDDADLLAAFGRGAIAAADRAAQRKAMPRRRKTLT